jgi:hypothetical protein
MERCQDAQMRFSARDVPTTREAASSSPIRDPEKGKKRKRKENIEICDDPISRIIKY